MLVLGSAIASADTVAGDVAAGSGSVDVEAGSPINLTANLYLQRQGVAARDVSWTVQNDSGCSGVTVGTISPNVLTLPDSWTGLSPSSSAFSQDAPHNAKSTASVTGTAGASGGSCVITFRGESTTSGALSGGNRDVTMTINFVAPQEPTNTAPTTPGKPAASTSPSQGAFILNWTASSDDGLPDPPAAITYALQGQRADESDFSEVAPGLTTNSHAFAAGSPAEGTWTYRVRASDSELESDWSDPSDPVVVDRTAPTLNACSGESFLLNSGNQAVSITADDGNLPDGSSGSGVDAVASTLSGIVDTSSVGSKQVTFTAVDNAGNQDTKQCSYDVGYVFDGFDRPVVNDARNVVKAGQAVPLKFRLTDATGAPVLAGVTASLSVANLACDRDETANLTEEVWTGKSGLQNLGDGYYQFNWATPKSYANSCKTMKLNLGEGTPRTAAFEFRR